MLSSIHTVIRRCSSNKIFYDCALCIYKRIDPPNQLKLIYGTSRVVRNFSALHESGPVRNPEVSEFNSVSSNKFEVVSRKPPLQLKVIHDALLSMKSPSTDELNNFRNKVFSCGNTVTESNIDAIVIGCCVSTKNLKFANTYLEFLEEKGEVNVATLSKYLKLCYACGKVDDEGKILQVYYSLREKLPLMDASTAENLIRGLSITSEWRKGLELINVVKETCSPTASTYSALIIAAFRNEDVQLGWNLLEECIKEDKVPLDSVYITWMELFCTQEKGLSHDQFKMTEDLLNFLSSHELLVSVAVTKKIKSVFESMNWRGDFTSIDDRCRCKSCKAEMNPIFISKSEFQTLSKAFLEKVLVGSDVFSKSTPEEVEAFQSLIANNAPYNTVIDGLNVAYSAGSESRGSHHSSAALLQSVVEYFVDLSHKILVLGRSHMNSWPKKEMDYIRSNSHLFLAENLSQDDPFLLYAAMSSGTGTCFLSRDLMRSHAHRLKCAEPGLVKVFRRWQLSHQMRLMGFSKFHRVVIKYPLEYSPIVQKVDGKWHIPFQDDQESTAVNEKAPQSFLDPPSRWLCLSPKKPGEKLFSKRHYGGKFRSYKDY